MIRKMKQKMSMKKSSHPQRLKEQENLKTKTKPPLIPKKTHNHRKILKG